MEATKDDDVEVEEAEGCQGEKQKDDDEEGAKGVSEEDANSLCSDDAVQPGESAGSLEMDLRAPIAFSFERCWSRIRS